MCMCCVCVHVHVLCVHMCVCARVCVHVHVLCVHVCVRTCKLCKRTHGEGLVYQEWQHACVQYTHV